MMFSLAYLQALHHSLSEALFINLFVFAGGLDSKSQVASLRNGPDIVIATPGRLVDHLHNAPTFSLHTVEIIVLDEADRWVLNACSHMLLRV